MLQKGKANVLIDGQLGSTGKGLWAGYLAKTETIDLAVTNAAPNAGHTYIDGKYKIINKHLPTSGVVGKCEIYINAGAVIDPDVFHKEMEEMRLTHADVTIHPRAAIITAEHKQSELRDGSSAQRLGSTQSGVGAAICSKLSRDRGSIAAEEKSLQKYIDKINLNERIESGETILIEVPQGYDLGINEGLSFPYCTSRSVTVGQALADANVHPRHLGHVSMTLRTFPIRVGHIYGQVEGQEVMVGNSGPFWPDSEEISWSDLGVKPELTTVTQRERRVATFSRENYLNSCNNIKPNSIFFNFANYMKRGEFEMLVHKCWNRWRPEFTFYGVGADVKNVHEYSVTHGAEKVKK